MKTQNSGPRGGKNYGNPYFNPETIKKATFKLTLWRRLLFWFLPTYVALDSGWAVFYKTFRGTVYILKEERTDKFAGEPLAPFWRRYKGQANGE